MAVGRAEWRAVPAGLGPGRLVFVDETWATTNMARRYGCGPTAARVVDRAPHGQTITLVAALRADRRTATKVIDGALTGDLFAAYVEQALAPGLRPGDVVVTDHLACHQRAEARRAIERGGGRRPAAVLARPELHRAGVRQAQGGTRRRGSGPSSGCRPPSGSRSTGSRRTGAGAT